MDRKIKSNAPLAGIGPTLWLLLWLPLFLAAPDLRAQYKYEREYRITEKEVPVRSADFVRSFPFEGKIKWYAEESQAGKTIEAKALLAGRKYSLEFDTAGRLLDIEVVIPWSGIPADVRTNISQRLDSLYSRHRIGKIQLQYAGDPDNIRASILQQEIGEGYTTRYEIVIDGQVGRSKDSWELHFTRDGVLEKMSRIIFRNTDNLSY